MISDDHLVAAIIVVMITLFAVTTLIMDSKK